MKHTDGRFTGAGQHSIYFQCWTPDSAPKAMLLLVHGAGEHSGRYQSFAQFFTAHNYAVAALDYQGHGKSEGRPGFVDAFADYLDDLALLQQQLDARLPTFLVGHSMGGLIASLYLAQQERNFIGAVLSGAAITTELKPGKLQMLLLRLLAVLAPRLGVLKLDAAGVSRDPEVVREYVEDPQVFHGKMSVRMVRELFGGMEQIQQDAARIALPLLILHGGEDVLTSPQGSRYLYQHVSSRDKTLTIYPGLYHEIFNEPERAEVLQQVLDWCDARLATTPVITETVA
jgi:alpha-beta hydrolase superfamily lysophospholipase